MVHRRQLVMTTTLLLRLLLATSYISASAALLGSAEKKKIPPHKKCKGASGVKKSKGTKAPMKSKGTKAPMKSKGVKKGKGCDDSLPSAAPSTSPQPSPGPSAYPSANPTRSAEPSNNPSSRPSQRPSITPSQYPSSSPTISNKPTVSAQPTYLDPENRHSPWCSTIDSGGEPPQTNNAITGNYYYNMDYNTDNYSLATILERLDDSIMKDLIKGHIWCGQDEFKDRESRSLNLVPAVPDQIVGLKIQTSFDDERSLFIDGISLHGPDLPHSQCTSSSSSNLCQTFKGNFTLYLRDNSILNNNQAKTAVLHTIRDGMNPNNGTLVSLNDGVEKLHFIGETLVEDSNNGVGGVFDGSQPIASVGLSALGYSLIMVGSVITLLFIFAATRKKNHHRTERMEELYEEEQDLFGKGIGLDDMDNETDLMSTGSFRHGRNVQILGDEHSQYGLGRYNGPETSRLGQRGDSLDVHKCTSATCPICTQRLKDPTFVKSLFPIELSGAKPRCYAVPDTVDM